ncbi:MAG: BrnA antitoxin family protein [Magnetococcales bacterium]|nr:BrnA antitoxin family protein [Magnetococcales bacterium]
MEIETPTPEEDAAITLAALADPDNLPLTEAELSQVVRPRSAKQSPKISTTVRFDRDIITAFRASGRGWQTRMNDALRDWLKSHAC